VQKNVFGSVLQIVTLEDYHLLSLQHVQDYLLVINLKNVFQVVFILLKLKDVGINVLNFVLMKNIQNVIEFLLKKVKVFKDVQLKLLV